MKTFFLGAGIAVAALGAVVADPITIGLAIASICLTALIPDRV